ncbi:MAG: ATP-binding cassette domain-containing protein, partial [Candidatus Eisenbacteria bacterium]|nr:ATP-binding cassette domain-containing protein [Candidatus Eisenbacteria bacterium]
MPDAMITSPSRCRWPTSCRRSRAGSSAIHRAGCRSASSAACPPRRRPVDDRGRGAAPPAGLPGRAPRYPLPAVIRSTQRPPWTHPPRQCNSSRDTQLSGGSAAVIKVEGLHKSFGGQVIFRDVSWTLGHIDRVGLVGANGSGKSTLLRLLLGHMEPDAGAIERPATGRLGYLAQNDFTLASGPDGTPLAEAWCAFPEIQAVERRLEKIRRSAAEDPPASGGGEAADPAGLEEPAREQAELQHRRQILDADGVVARVARTLRGLGFGDDDFQRPLQTFSHGWQMRAALARLLLQEPDVLLLDEPTNHLDLESRAWLADFLTGFNGALVIVSHDRDFLDRTVTRITEILGGGLEDYRGGYSDYERQREERHQLRWKAYRQQTDQIARIRDWIARNRAQKRLASRVQSRVRMLEKMERIQPPEGPPSVLRVSFPQPARLPRVVARLEEIHKSYDGRPLFRGLNLELQRGDRLAVVGSNGAGKSTLLRILAGREPVQSGRVHLA